MFEFNDEDYQLMILDLYHKPDSPTVNPVDPLASLGERVAYQWGFSLSVEDSTIVINDTLGQEVVRVRRPTFMAAQYWAARALANPLGFVDWLNRVS